MHLTTNKPQKLTVKHQIPRSSQKVIAAALNAYPIEPTNAAQCLFWQRCLFSPCKSTLVTAATQIDLASSFPVMTSTFIRKNYVHTAATPMGHLNRTRKNLKSTKNPPSNSNPKSLKSSQKAVYVHIYKPTYHNYSDATGTFLKTNLHFLVMYHYDSNYIHAAALTDYSAASYYRAYLDGLAIYAAARPNDEYVPTYEIADNAMTQQFIRDLAKKNIQTQLVAPGNHRANNAERAIQTFKCHFISGLATCDPSFPVSEAKQLTQQALISLNLLRRSRLNPKISAYQEMHGIFDANRFELHPPGTKVITLDDPSERASFANHGPEGFYVGPSLTHYRCHRIYIPSMKKTRISDSVAWLPSTPIVPTYPTLPPGLFISQPPQQIAPPNPNASPIQPPLPINDSFTSEGVQYDDEEPLTIPMTPSYENTRHDDPISPIEYPSTSEGAPKAFYVHYEKAIQGMNHDKWIESMDTEMRRLITKTGSMEYLPDGIAPSNAKIGMANPIIAEKIRMDGSEFRTRLTWSKNIVVTDGPTSSSTVDLTAVKLLLNSIVSDPHAKCSVIDISDFYLNSKLPTPAYLWVPMRFLPYVTRKWLGVLDRPRTDKLLFKVYNAIYGMDDAGRISQQDLVRHLAPHGYHMTAHSPCIFTHDTNSTVFTTFVDDFLIKTDSRTNDFDHLKKILELKYPIKYQEEATKYLGFTISLKRFPNHELDSLTISMPGFVKKGLQMLNFKQTYHPKSPSVYTAPIYGNKIQFEEEDSSPPATKLQEAYLRKAVGIFRYYAQCIDGVSLHPISKLALKQSNPSTRDMEILDRFLNYMADNLDSASITYRPSDMQLHIHSDESYLSEAKSRSRHAGFSTCGEIIYSPNGPSKVNGPIRVSSTIIPTVVGSATEASYASLYLNAQDATIDRQTLVDIGHPQQPTLITYDNQPAGKIALKTAKIKKSKAIAMRYHWIQDRIQSGEFRINWKPGPHNIADFPSKAHPVHHFLTMRPLMYNNNNPQAPTDKCSREGVLIPPCAIKKRPHVHLRTAANTEQEIFPEHS
jgi:hypothetical protein